MRPYEGKTDHQQSQTEYWVGGLKIRPVQWRELEQRQTEGNGKSNLKIAERLMVLDFSQIYRGSDCVASVREGSGRDDESLVSRGDSGWATEYDRHPIGHSFRPPQLPNMKVVHRISRGF